MLDRWKIRTRAAVLAVLIVGVSCADIGDGPTMPPVDVLPAAAVLDVNGESFELFQGFLPNPLGNGASCDALGRPDPSPRQLRSAVWIGPFGGAVTIVGGQVGGRVIAHVLTVPPLAVKSNTLFCMALEPTNHMQVRLQAHGVSNGKVVDVGEAGFRVPVTLTLTYAPLRLSALTARKVVVLHDPENGRPYELMPSVSVPLLNIVVSELPHFSKYAMAVD